MVRGPTHPPSRQPGTRGSWRVCRCITSPSTCSRGSRATTSGSSGPCRGSAAFRPSTQRDGPSRASKPCCGCARALALRVPGRCASRTGCSRSASVSRRLIKCKLGADPAHPAAYTRVCDTPVVPEGLRLADLPPYSPELQPAEHLWPILDEPLANRYFATLADLERTVADRCRVLDGDQLSLGTNFHWWPKSATPS